MKNKLNICIATAALTLLPFVAFARGRFVNCPDSGGTTLCDIVDMIIGYFNIALVLLMSFAVLMFTFNVIRYYVLANEERKAAGLYVMYSVIGFFVILSLWGIVNILSNTFGGLNNSSNSATLRSNLPLFKTTTGG